MPYIGPGCYEKETLITRNLKKLCSLAHSDFRDDKLLEKAEKVEYVTKWSYLNMCP